MTNWGHVLWAAMAAARSGAPDRGPAAGAGALPLLGAIGLRSHCPPGRGAGLQLGRRCGATGPCRCAGVADQVHQIEGLPLLLVTCPQLGGHQPAITRGAHLVEVVRLAGNRAGAVVLLAARPGTGVADQVHQVEGLQSRRGLVSLQCAADIGEYNSGGHPTHRRQSSLNPPRRGHETVRASGANYPHRNPPGRTRSQPAAPSSHQVERLAFAACRSCCRCWALAMLPACCL